MAKLRIGILTGGGDCPGLNAVIRGVTKSAITQHGAEVIGFQDGFLGLMEERYFKLDFNKVSGILTQGGTILGTSNTANPFAKVVRDNGSRTVVDVSDKCMELYRDLGLDALICIGGDGTLSIAGQLSEKGAQVVGVPKTIDKDLMETDTTFGFDSARAMATDAIDRLHSTAESHQRIMLVEVMGRNAGWLALESGVAGGGDIVLIPEIPYDLDEIVVAIRRRSRLGKKFCIIVVSEGAKPVGGDQVVSKIVEDSPEQKRLGGVSHVVAHQLEQRTGYECRVAVLGHLQRGGTPTPCDRLLATQFGVKAMDLVLNGLFNHMVAVKGNDLVAVPISHVMNRQKLVPLDSPLVNVAMAVGMSFGAHDFQPQY